MTERALCGLLFSVLLADLLIFLTFVGHNLVRLEEEGSVLEVHGFTLQLVLHYVNQGQLITQILSLHMRVKRLFCHSYKKLAQIDQFVIVSLFVCCS